MATIGTAGHVDHGKSTLVRALTGIDPDRLAEEKARGMTIDLGFAWLTLPDGRAVSIVDVPGHEDFIHNMLAGVGGIDLALLVVAADEGVMPQTREHLAILDLLRVPRGIVALTKADLVDADWLELAREDVAATLAPTILHSAPIIPVSAVTGAGLPELIAALAGALPVSSPISSEASPRLPIDRVFTITGFGTVVTGTLLDGAVRVGQELAIMPADLRGRVRGIQQHKAAVTEAQPGTRVALNLAGIDRTQIARGMVATLPGTLAATTLLDVEMECWSGAPREIAHNATLNLAIGAAETPAQVRLLTTNALAPGERGWAQLRLAQPVAVARGDRFILRNPSPSETLGGGSVADPQARHHRRQQPDVLARLAALLSGDATAIVRVSLSGARGPARLLTGAELATRTHLSPAAILPALAVLVAHDTITAVGEWYIAREQWAALQAEAQATLAAYHRLWPLRMGMPREAWRAKLDLAPRQVEAVLARLQHEGIVREVTTSQGGRDLRMVAAADHQPTFTPAQAAMRAALLARLQAAPFDPPAPEDLKPASVVRAELAAQGAELPRSQNEPLRAGSLTELSLSATEQREVLAALVEQGTLVRLNDDLVLLATTFAAARDAILAHLQAQPQVTVAEVRDLLGTTRRVIVPLLENLDAQRLTLRLGDARVLGPAARSAIATPPPGLPATAPE